jgi:hypothetical protein
MTVYVAVSGATVGIGRFFNPDVATALVGDSLTQNSGYELTTATWMGGIAGGVLRPVANIGVAGETTAQILARIDNSYTAGSPGLAGLASALGLPKLGSVFLRCGTNDARGLNNWSGISSNFATLVTKCLTYADQVIIGSVPPITSPEANAAAKDAAVQNINAGLLSTYGGGAFAGVVYIDDGAALRVGGVPSGAGISGYFQDGVHMNYGGARRMGVAGGDLLVAAYAARGYSYPLQVVTSNSDTYLSNPASQQWVDNPAMLGSNVSSAPWVGQIVNGFAVGAAGSGAGTVSIVAADVGDPNQTPWQRVAPTAGQTTGWTQVGIANTGRAITASDPSRMEAIVQVRFNALDVTNIRRLTFFARGNTTNNQYLLPQFWLPLGPEATTVTKTVTMRSNLPRGAGANESSIALALALEYQNTFSGANIGSFDVRCPSLRG